jgi:hypothetical protein
VQEKDLNYTHTIIAFTSAIIMVFELKEAFRLSSMDSHSFMASRPDLLFSMQCLTI